MKHYLITAAAGLGLLVAAQPALAQAAAEGEVTITGSVADRCLFTLPSQVINLGELSLPGTDANAGRLDPGKVNGANATLQGWCNGTAATMKVEALPIVNTSFTSSPASGFDRVVNYTATATANTFSASDQSGVAGAGTDVSVGMFTGPIPVVLSAPSTPGGGILVAGNYLGLVKVTLTPNTSFGSSD